MVGGSRREDGFAISVEASRRMNITNVDQILTRHPVLGVEILGS